LKNFKFEIEKEKIKNIINETIEIVKEDLSKDDLTKFEKESLDCSLDNINEWVSKVKSFAYEVSKGATLKNKKTYTNIVKWETDDNVKKSLWGTPKK
jgi:methyl coenzyme M reductase subunit D